MKKYMELPADYAVLSDDEMTYTLSLIHIYDDQGFRLSGMGNAGTNGGPAGDVIVAVTVQPSEVFQRDENNIYVVFPITYSQAVLGDTITVPSIDGKVEVNVPEGTQSAVSYTHLDVYKRQPLDRVTRARVEAVFASLDHEPEKLAQGAAKALAAISGCTAAVSTPCAEDLCVAHYEVVQVGRSAAAVLAVTTAGYVRTRVARVRTGLSREKDVYKRQPKGTVSSPGRASAWTQF